MRNAFLAAVLAVANATPALAADTTVNSHTSSQDDRAKAAIVKAGYQPEQLAMVQDGNFFFTATKGGDLYQATVTKSGKVYFSTGTPVNAAAPPAG